MLEISHNMMTEPDVRPEIAASASRRSFLKGLAAVSITALVDKKVTDEHWPETETELAEIAGTDPDAWLTAPGYGSVRGQLMMQQVRRNQGVSQTTPMAAFKYGNSVVTVPHLNELVSDFSRRHRLAERAGSLSLYCHSMGGIIGLTTARAAGVPIRDIILNGSPFDIDDAQMGRAARIAAIASEATGYQGSLFSKFVGAAYKEFAEEGVDDISDIIDNVIAAGEKSWSGAAPYCMGSQLRILNDYPLVPEQFKGIIEPGYTRAVYCMPEDTSADKTVKVTQAAEKYAGRLFGPLGIDLQRILLPVPAHANTVDAMAHTADFLRARFGKSDNDTAADAALTVVQNR